MTSTTTMHIKCEPVERLPVFADLIRASHLSSLRSEIPELVSRSSLRFILDGLHSKDMRCMAMKSPTSQDEFTIGTSYSLPCSPVTGAVRQSIKKETTRKPRPASRTCKFEGCAQYVVDHGLCVRHGGGKRCTVEGCSSRAKHFGRCWRHGGSMECKIDDCNNRAKSRGYCWSHGGGTKCKGGDCEKIAISNGLCWAHGGGKRCRMEGCTKQAYERTRNLCNSHFQRWKREPLRFDAA